jgi:hypothetical protein
MTLNLLPQHLQCLRELLLLRLPLLAGPDTTGRLLPVEAFLREVSGVVVVLEGARLELLDEGGAEGGEGERSVVLQ